MADSRKEYTVSIHGVEHSMLLDPEDAQTLYGDNAKEAKKPRTKSAAAPANKARGAANKSDGTADADASGEDSED